MIVLTHNMRAISVCNCNPQNQQTHPFQTWKSESDSDGQTYKCFPNGMNEIRDGNGIGSVRMRMRMMEWEDFECGRCHSEWSAVELHTVSGEQWLAAAAGHSYNLLCSIESDALSTGMNIHSYSYWTSSHSKSQYTQFNFSEKAVHRHSKWTSSSLRLRHRLSRP